jgi:hypothetical protein
MIKKLDVFLNWLLKEGIALMLFSAIMLVIIYALINVFNNPNI